MYEIKLNRLCYYPRIKRMLNFFLKKLLDGDYDEDESIILSERISEDINLQICKTTMENKDFHWVEINANHSSGSYMLFVWGEPDFYHNYVAPISIQDLIDNIDGIMICIKNKFKRYEGKESIKICMCGDMIDNDKENFCDECVSSFCELEDRTHVCAICIDPERNLGDWRKLPCNHIFHSDCLLQITEFNNHRKCPLCRSDFKMIQVSKL